MKHVVVSSELREADIRPAKPISKFMELSIRDARAMLADSAQFAPARRGRQAGRLARTRTMTSTRTSTTRFSRIALTQ